MHVFVLELKCVVYLTYSLISQTALLLKSSVEKIKQEQSF